MSWVKYVSLQTVLFLLMGGMIGCDQEHGVRSPVNPANLLMNAAQGGSGTLHAILVADTNASDIQVSVQADLKTMDAFVARVAAQAGLHLNKQVFAADAVTLSAVETAVKDVQTGPTDVVIFYYSGHGGRPVEQKARWPRMYFSSDASGAGMDLNAVFVVLSRKDPDFLLVLTDPCNALDQMIKVPDETEGSPAVDKERPDAYRKLFVETRGRVIAAGARLEENGLGSAIGGRFTQQFLQALHQSLTMEQTPDWKTIMDQAIRPLGTTQHPQYLIY